jgi:hypothetical protein
VAPLSELPQRCRVNVVQLAELPSAFTLFEQLTGALRRGLPDIRSSDWVVDEALTRLTALRRMRAPAISSLARSVGVSERALVKKINPSWKEPSGTPITLCFAQESPKVVDALYDSILAAGFRGARAPWDAFWGQRYSSVLDPDGNQIDLFAAL